MSNKPFYITLWFSLILFLSLGRDPVISGTLTMDSPQRLSLDAGQPSALNISLPQSRPSSFDLYLRAAPINGDPFQVPLLTLSGADYTRHCFSADAEFAGVCRIRSSDLIGKALTVVVRCMVECQLQVEAYLSQQVRLEAGKALDLSAKNGDLDQVVHLQAPRGNYTLALMAVILNPEQSIQLGEEGVDVLVNLGAEAKDPNQESFQLKGSSLSGGGKGVFLYNATEGELIRCLIKLKKGVSIRFSVSPLKGNQFAIALGNAYYDFALPNESKQYDLNMTGLIDEDETLELVFDVYSGRPEFQLSFFPGFSELIDFPQTASANSILISPQIRKRFKYNGTLYIRVKTAQNAQYYFYTQLVRDDVTYLQPYLTYFDEVQSQKVSNYILFERYRLDKMSQTLVKNYSFKVEIEGGRGSFHFKRCPSLQKKASDNPSLGDCLYASGEQLRSQKFYSQQIQNRHIQYGDMMTIYMVYDVSKCTLTQDTPNHMYALCAFHIMALGQSSDRPFSFSLLPERKYLTNYLREGKLVKEYIPKDNYAYFALSLTQIDYVEEVNFFLTALSGQASLIVSTTEQLPSFSSIGKYQTGSKCNIVLGRSQLAKEIYIAVYAYRFTEVNLGVIVHRKSDNASVHDIPLQEGNLQTYLLNKTQRSAQFIVSVREQQEITVLVNEVAGHVSVAVFDRNKKVVNCNQPKDRLTCSFSPQKYSNYTVKIEGEKGSPQSKFSISYKSEKSSCFSSNLNHPIYISLPGHEQVCHSFPLNREIDLSLAISFTHLQTMDKQISTEILLNDQPFQNVDKTHWTITVSDMIGVCPMGTLLGGFPKTCKISIKFKNNIDKDNHFSFVLEQQDADIALFDGVNEKVRGKSAEIGKNFYYQVTSNRPIQIFFSTQTLKSHYFLCAQFVSNQDFLTRGRPNGKVVYLPYVPSSQRPQEKIDDRRNYYTAVLGMTGLQTISIGSEAIKQYCPQSDCHLTIGIFREQYENNIQTDEDFYQVQVTQEETVLYLGQTKVGTVDKGQIYTYLVNPEDAIVEFKLLDDSGKRGVCFFAEAALANGTVLRKNELSLDLQVRKPQGVERIYVRGRQDSCSFSISYLSNEIPYRIVRLSQPYELDLRAKQSARFIYYHQNPRSFKLANLVSAGECKAYILPIKNSTFTLTNLPKINFNSYPFVTSFDGEFSMLQTDLNFCSKCYYYIYVTAERRFVGQVVFLRMYDPVPLSTNHIFREHLIPLTPLGVENYIYYAMASFNFTVNMLSGKISVSVVDPQGRTVVSEELTESREYEFEAIDYRQKEKIQFYSQRTKYRVRIASIVEAQFYLEVTRDHLTQRIFEGLPANILLNGDETQTVEFINSQDLKKPLNLMIDLQEEGGKPVLLTFSIKGVDKDGKTLPSADLLKGTTKSDNTYIIDLANFEGRYFINVHSNVKVNSTFILVKNSLTHISPKQNYLFNAPAVYQLFSNYKKVLIEVFNCQGEPTLFGSKEERDMEQSFKGASPIAIKRPNYAGHYVFSIQREFSSYFVRVGSKQPSQALEYLINYYYYQSVNPYDAVDVSSYDISAEFNKDGDLRLNVSPPALLDYRKGKSDVTVEINILEVTYNAYVSANLLDLKRRSRCAIQGIVVEKNNQTKPNVTIEKKIMESLKTSNETTLYATVQASIKISIKKQGNSQVQNSPQVLTLFYNTLQMTAGGTTITTEFIQTSKTYWFTDNIFIFIGWMLLPFILAAGTLYYLLKFCVGKLMRHQASMVQQVEIVPSNQTVPTEQKIAEGGESGQLPNTGTQLIKQSI